MSKNPHCKKCKIEITDKETAIKKSGYYYCKSCGEQVEQNNDEFGELYEYIRNLYEIKQLNGMMLKQIKNFKEEYNYTYKGMYLSLVYFYDLLENTLKENVGLGIIPFVYEEAKQHYINQLKVIKTLKKIEQPLVTDKIINIKKMKKNENINTNLRLIDLNDL